MKRPLFALRAAMSLIVAAACAVVAWAGGHVAAAARNAYDGTVRMVSTAFTSPVQPPEPQAVPETFLTAAKTFALRLLRRDRERFSGWRGQVLPT